MRMIRRLTLTGFATFGVLTGGLAFFSAPLFAFTFPEAEFTGDYIPFESFKVPAPTSVAVEASTGDVFVVSVVKNEEEGEAKVIKLNPEGTTVLGEFSVPGFPDGVTLSWDVAVDNSCSLHEPALTETTTPTCKEFDPSNGDVYVTNLAYQSGVEKFKPKSGEPSVYELVESLPTAEGEEKRGQTGVAVDSSGNVYASMFHDAGEIFKFNSLGKPLSSLSGANWRVPNGVTVDEAGNVYVPGITEGLAPVGIDELNAEGQFQCEVVVGKAVAVNPASGEVFVLDSQAGPVTRYGSGCVEKVPPVAKEGFGTGEIGESAGIAYSSNTHDVYVTDYATGEVHIYERGTPGPAPEVTACEAKEPKATSVALACTINPNASRAEWQFEYEQAGTTGFKKAPKAKQEITSTGAVTETITGLKPQTGYVYRLVAFNEHGVMRFPATGTLPFETLPAVAGVTACAASSVAAEGATLKASLEPKGVLTRYHFEYGESMSYGSETAVKESEAGDVVNAETSLTGLEPNRTYDCRLVAGREIEGTTYTTYGENGMFVTKARPPKIVSQFATNVESTSAQLYATIDPENSPSTYYMEYVEAARYHPAAVNPYEEGVRTPAPEGAVGSDVGYHAVAQVLEGLIPGTTYHFRVVATNSPEPGTGTIDGADQTLTTAGESPPVVVTGAAGGLTLTGATLLGTVNPAGYATSYVFEIGATEAYGTDLAGTLSSGGTEAQSVTLALANLAPLTTYHYRLSATNANGTSYGQDQTFATPGTDYSLTLPLTPPLLTTPAIAFPTEMGVTTKISTKALTRAQKLAAALKACKKEAKGKRAACEKQARKRYGRNPKQRRAPRGGSRAR